MPIRSKAITADEFNEALDRLKLTPYGSARILGISLSQAHRYASGEQPVSLTVAKLLDMLQRHGIPRAWRERD